MSVFTLLLPIFYVLFLVGILVLARRVLKSKNKDEDDSYFPINKPKLEYQELAEQYSPDIPSGKKVLVVALMKRAMEGITRVIRIREEKPSLQQMVRDGVVGEALWDKLLATEADIETEMQDIVEESNIYKPDWGKTFLQEASALVQNKLQQEAQKAAEELNATETVQSPVHKTKKSAPKAELVETDEERRERLQNELIEEEEKSKATKKKGKKAK